jgi:hypothetical protein
VRVVGARETLAEATRRARGLQHGHARDALRHLRVDLASQLARAGDRAGGQPLVAEHDADGRGNEQQHHEHEAPVEPKHRHDDAEQHGHPDQDLEEHLDVEVLHGLGVVGDAADELSGDRPVEEAHRQLERMRVHAGAQALHRTCRQAGEPHELEVANDRRDAAGREHSGEKQRDRGNVAVARKQVLVDEALAEDGARSLEQAPQRRAAARR